MPHSSRRQTDQHKDQQGHRNQRRRLSLPRIRPSALPEVNYDLIDYIDDFSNFFCACVSSLVSANHLLISTAAAIG